jgi:DNA adenine methylase
LDPPYYPISDTSNFTGYTKNCFQENDHIKLFKIYKRLDQRGCRLMLSNSDHVFIRNLYQEYKVKNIKALRTINCNAEKRGKINEIVILNY